MQRFTLKMNAPQYFKVTETAHPTTQHNIPHFESSNSHYFMERLQEPSALSLDWVSWVQSKFNLYWTGLYF